MRAHNADSHELAKFDQATQDWWDPLGEFRPLHELNPLRLGFIESHLGRLPGQRIADIGCGGGILSEAMARLGAEVVGIDLAEQALSSARAHAEQSALNIDYRLCDADSLAEAEAGQFDAVTCMEMLEHVPDPAAVVRACAQLLRPGGQAFFSTLSQTRKAWLQAIVGAEYILRLLPRGTHDYKKFIRPAQLGQWCRSEQLQIQALQGITYQPLGRFYHYCDAVDVNYMAVARRMPLQESAHDPTSS